jgi:hypothetical protein
LTRTAKYVEKYEVERGRDLRFGKKR